MIRGPVRRPSGPKTDRYWTHLQRRPNQVLAPYLKFRNQVLGHRPERAEADQTRVNSSIRSTLRSMHTCCRVLARRRHLSLAHQCRPQTRRARPGLRRLRPRVPSPRRPSHQPFHRPNLPSLRNHPNCRIVRRSQSRRRSHRCLAPLPVRCRFRPWLSRGRDRGRGRRWRPCCWHLAPCQCSCQIPVRVPVRWRRSKVGSNSRDQTLRFHCRSSQRQNLQVPRSRFRRLPLGPPSPRVPQTHRALRLRRRRSAPGRAPRRVPRRVPRQEGQLLPQAHRVHRTGPHHQRPVRPRRPVPLVRLRSPTFRWRALSHSGSTS
jgi:hypothetical protein